MHTASGRTAYSLRVLAMHALLEIPVLTVTALIILAQPDAPFSSQLPHIVSIAQTVTGLTFHALWLCYSRRQDSSERSSAKGATAVAPSPAQQESTAIVEVVSAN